MYGINYLDGVGDLNSEFKAQGLKSLKGILFTLMTDGFIIVLYLLKIYYGAKYLNIVYFLPKMEYQY